MSEEPLLTHHPASASGAATVRLRPDIRRTRPISPLLLGKFCEHLGANIYGGMHAQILANPTFGRWRFGLGDNHPDGGLREVGDLAELRRRAEGHARRRGVPDPGAAAESYLGGVALGWVRLGPADAVRTSPDVGPHGGRAQRLEVLSPGPESAAAVGGRGAGALAQWVHLPLHRTHGYEFRVVARSAGPLAARLEIASAEGAAWVSAPLALDDAWQTITGRLCVPDNAAAFCRVALLVAPGGNVVVDRVLLYPDDHVGGADPEVISWLRAGGLPLLRWPGGNFVSGYHWRDGVGPVDARPTLPNPAWDGLECNLFGTHEFVAFCRAVGCEPMFCVNAGNGSAEEAAAWVEYCNGAADTPLGRLRAANGHPDPFRVRFWEVGNEIWGRWQVGWTTAAGNADRFRRFAAAMRAADPDIEIMATGPQCVMDQEWTHTLLRQGGPQLRAMTDHLLSSADIGPGDDPWDVFQAYMGHAVDAARQYAWLRERMLARGIPDPWLALTEMQVFCHWRPRSDAAGSMTPEQLIHPSTLAEAAYFATFLCACVRLDGFVRLITHSATVNHGGGLRKEHERVYPNPVHHAHAMAAHLAGCRPVGVELLCATYDTRRRYGFIPPLAGIPVLDAVAGIDGDGRRVVLLVQRAAEPLRVTLDAGEPMDGTARVIVLSGAAPWSTNRLEAPDRIAPRETQRPLASGVLELDLPPAALAVVILPPA
ncbi:MAG: alpha-N-arabinofuranosidase [Lentisphaeria bacterium]|nr:alpha-N-arabinofuranosidase [Lentisphaeria bacterium]